MKTILTTLAAMSSLLLLGACDSKQEQVREKTLEKKADNLENQADLTRKKGEAEADAIEKRDPGLNGHSTRAAAEAVRENAEKTADGLENQADGEREKK